MNINWKYLGSPERAMSYALRAAAYQQVTALLQLMDLNKLDVFNRMMRFNSGDWIRVEKCFGSLNVIVFAVELVEEVEKVVELVPVVLPSGGIWFREPVLVNGSPVYSVLHWDDIKLQWSKLVGTVNVGNLDWRGPDGMVLSWDGYHRYWDAPWLEGAGSGWGAGTEVFYNGAVIATGAEFISGACSKNGKLFYSTVVTLGSPDFTTTERFYIKDSLSLAAEARLIETKVWYGDSQYNAFYGVTSNLNVAPWLFNESGTRGVTRRVEYDVSVSSTNSYSVTRYVDINWTAGTVSFNDGVKSKILQTTDSGVVSSPVLSVSAPVAGSVVGGGPGGWNLTVTPAHRLYSKEYGSSSVPEPPVNDPSWSYFQTVYWAEVPFNWTLEYERITTFTFQDYVGDTEVTGEIVLTDNSYRYFEQNGSGASYDDFINKLSYTSALMLKVNGLIKVSRSLESKTYEVDGLTYTAPVGLTSNFTEIVRMRMLDLRVNAWEIDYYKWRVGALADSDTDVLVSIVSAWEFNIPGKLDSVADTGAAPFKTANGVNLSGVSLPDSWRPAHANAYEFLEVYQGVVSFTYGIVRGLPQASDTDLVDDAVLNSGRVWGISGISLTSQKCAFSWYPGDVDRVFFSSDRNWNLYATTNAYLTDDPDLAIAPTALLAFLSKVV